MRALVLQLLSRKRWKAQCSKMLFPSVPIAVTHKHVLDSFSPVCNENQGTELGSKKLLGHLVDNTKLATLPSCLSCIINLFTE